MSKKISTKNYPREFREKAVKFVTERGYTLEQVAQQLGPDTAQRIANDEDKFKRLRKENAQLKLEVENLKSSGVLLEGVGS